MLLLMLLQQFCKTTCSINQTKKTPTTANQLQNQTLGLSKTKRKTHNHQILNAAYQILCSLLPGYSFFRFCLLTQSLVKNKDLRVISPRGRDSNPPVHHKSFIVFPLLGKTGEA